ncbi:response regulator [Paenibacillus methanolicus]|uniref:Two-component SAPR family response regulator n=1 Tax=Paenibacillus methanolicus TaxID=582686 RepID=A0A5S5BRB2_9BACL|nr:response regulator [Paenibacillus methanolicus]TYP69619.1 two-component SAPR family response regulator [Paenibacillus methanolicus]
MKVILVDDEPTMHLILRKMLHKLPGIQVAGAFTETKSAEAFLRGNPDVGLAFIDISMKDEDGMAFAARLEPVGLLQIVFVTSHKDFALEAFELSALDYLVKPVSQERLQRTVNRALANWQAFRSSSFASPAAPRDERVTVTVLGDVSVRNGTVRVKWISRKCAELFAYLLLHHSRRIPRSRLIADIFGGMDQTNAENYLNTTVYQLRKSLAPLGLREAVRSENDGYAIDLSDPVIDYIEFARQADALPLIDAANIENAMEAERLYAGDLFGDKGYVWAISETERYARLYASFAQRLALTLIALQDAAAASPLLVKLHERNPLDESVVRLLLITHEMRSDKKGFMAQYAGYVRLLDAELGIRPSEELVRFYDTRVIGFGQGKE